MGPLLAIFPHPDDETFTAGGLMAAATERGVPVTLVCATRGEAGESSLPDLKGTDRLGQVRENELREAMRQFGVSDVRFLGYRDSGMEGSAEANDPRAFVRAPVEQVAGELASIIRDMRPDIVVTFGQEGIYGHPDHLHAHQAVRQAVLLAADPALETGSDSGPWQTPSLYYGTAPREDLAALFERPDSPIPELSESALANLGTPRAEITHILDARPWLDAKRRAMAAHLTQTGESGPLDGVEADALEARLGWEHFVRAHLPWGTAGEPDLLEQLIAEPRGA